VRRFWTRSRSSDAERPISETPVPGAMSRGCIVLFFGIFFVAGAALSWFLMVRPALRILEARSWPEVPCTVVSSEVESHPGSDSTTYSVEISYSYEIDGRTYTGDRYNFATGSSSGYAHKANIVKQHPPGSRTVCRVDPDDPQRSVMSVDFDREYLWGLFGLPFLLVGLGGLVWVVRRPQPTTGKARWLPRLRRGEDEGKTVPGLPSSAAEGPLTLATGHRPLWRFLGVLFFAGLWNAMVGFLLWPAAREDGGCVWVFLLVFGAVGLVLLAGVPYAFLAMFNPRPTLTLDRSRPALGESCQVSWKWSGGVRRVERLRIFLQGREEATYRRGTDTRTEKHVFAVIDVVDTRQSVEIARGTGTLAIPADTMHSFEASRNKIVWRLKVAAEIPRWPDVAEELAVVIHPRRDES
jgi:hypothetical protein